MFYDPSRHHRRSIRLGQFDYSQDGYYFITLCAQDRTCFFGEIIENKMHLNDPGAMIKKTWHELSQRFSYELYFVREYIHDNSKSWALDQLFSS